MKVIKILLLMLLLIPLVQAKTDHTSLLTVGGENDTIGGIADLYLEIKPGSGTIFIDSFPLTKLDTQITTRFANEVACDFLKEDCSKYDFFYTIRAGATIVGGPSAGAATTILTISVLSDLELDENTIITGTINSGNLIGPVAGIDQKISAAIQNDFTTIILPKWQSNFNLSEIEDMGLDTKITIVKVKNLEEALYHFTGKDFSSSNNELAVSKDYSDKMSEVADILCSRTDEIKLNIEKSNNSLYNYSREFINRSQEAERKNEYYSRASFCFTANLRLRELEFSNKTKEELKLIYEETLIDFSLVEEMAENQALETLSDLETHMIVRQRLYEADGYLDQISQDNISYSKLAFAKERLYSAVAWSEFFELEGEKVQLDEEHLKTACLKKTAEAEERINYAELYLPGFLTSAKTEVASAFENYNDGHYDLCIFKSSKAKAEASILLSAISIHEDDLEKVVEEKIEAIKKVINEQEAKKMFPILGYSYLEYSGSLVEYDIVSALTFAEYSLEFSRLDMYFPKEKSFNLNIDINIIIIFVSGFIIGAALTMLVIFGKKKS